MALREIRVYDDEILRKVSKKVEIVDKKIEDILDDMVETMKSTGNGAGLAAPQVGILKRLAVIDMEGKFFRLINPEIIESKGSQEVIEGCLSVPGKWGKLNRPKWVKIAYQNEEGNQIEIEAEDELAKCFCHEIDHLNGILFIDKVIEYI